MAITNYYKVHHRHIGFVILLFIMHFTSPCILRAQNSEKHIASPTIQKLNNAAPGSQDILNFWKNIPNSGGGPIIEKDDEDSNYYRVTFLWRDNSDTLKRVAIKFWNRHLLSHQVYVDDGQLLRLNHTDVWYKTYRFRKDTRVSYQLGPNDDGIAVRGYSNQQGWKQKLANFRPDPLNPKKYMALDGESSILELPGAYQSEWLKKRNDAVVGKIEKKEWVSTMLNNTRDIWIYVPYNYHNNGQYNLLLFLDGGPEGYGSVPAVTILNNLIAEKKIAPAIAVFVGNAPGVRNTELHYNDKFADFISKELVPYLHSAYSITNNPARNIVIGSSAGGNEAALIAFKNEHIFGNVLTQSAGYMSPKTARPFPIKEGDFIERDFPETEWFSTLIRDNPKHKLRFRIDVGVFEDIVWEEDHPRFAQPSLLVATRHLRDLLKSKEYTFFYNEYNGGHEYLNWQHYIADGLIQLLR